MFSIQIPPSFSNFTSVVGPTRPPSTLKSNVTGIEVKSGSFSVSNSTPLYIGTGMSKQQQFLALLDAINMLGFKMGLDARLVTREHNRFIRETIAKQGDLEAAKMLSSALARLIGDVVQGALSVTAGAIQFGNACRSLNNLAAARAPVDAAMKAEIKATAKVNTAQQDLNKVKAQKLDGGPQEAALKEATEAQTVARADLKAAQKLFAGNPEIKRLDALRSYWDGVATALKGVGEAVDQGMKYCSAGEDAELHLLKSFTQYLQSTQQSSESFERELVDALKQTLDSMKAISSSVHQTSLNTLTYA